MNDANQQQNTTASQELLNYKETLERQCASKAGSEKTLCDGVVSKLNQIYLKVPAQLKKEINVLNDANKDTTVNLADKKTTVKIINQKTNNLKQHIDNIKQERLNKKRVVEASEWEYDRYNSHIYILKFIFFSLVIINIILYIRSRFPAIPNVIIFGLIVLVTAIMLYNVGIEMALNLKRDKFDYDKFKQTYGDEYNTNDGSLGVAPKSSSGSIFKNLLCESFVSSNKKDTLNRHTYSFI